VTGLTTLDERRITFAKTYGIKMRCYWELFDLNPPPLSPLTHKRKREAVPPSYLPPTSPLLPTSPNVAFIPSPEFRSA